jgi:hypothetical protein
MTGIKDTDFFKTALKLKQILEDSDEFGDLELDETDEMDGDEGIVQELRELMETMTDEDKEVVKNAFTIIKKYAEKQEADVAPIEDAESLDNVAPAQEPEVKE